MAERTVETTDDGRYIVVNGRKWRATDPAIPEPLRKQLVSALMTGRRLVKTKGDAARVMVHDAKVALGERGDPWWEPTDDGRRERLAATMRTLLRERGEKTICPSDAARVVGADDWRDLMPLTREIAVELRDAGVLAITQKGEEVTGTDFHGPLRLAARDGLEFQPHRES
ncbi:hypothetical protein B841_01320 [Corynebacterium maris DSM 45190]|uniref:DUF3253 domain-containing protein n=1 Tax=Corynebacterium maris DSM 45190 TaxID=1224163 RepID=S5SRU8_9CORY|nr:DUF3253 domain-containing protein [Corynebacterium maris]AGS33747.1 hypothetical protein B841_01320 [Corynebacterium maris DSM 45190]